MKTILKSRQNGFAIIEALIAFLLLGIGVAALVYLQGNLMSGSSQSKARAEAMELAKDRTEMLRNYIDRDQYLSALSTAQDDEPSDGVQGVNAKYNVIYDNVPTTASEAQKLTVRVKWEGSEVDGSGNPLEESVTLETMLYYMSPAIASGIEGGDEGADDNFPLLSPFITGVEGVDPNPPPSTGNDGTPDVLLDGVGNVHTTLTIKTYYNVVDGVTSYSNIEVIDSDGNVKLTSFGGIVHKLQGEIIIGSGANTTLGHLTDDLKILASPPSYCVFPICDGGNCAVVNRARYVCYVPGDCTYQDAYVDDDGGALNDCPDGFNPPEDDDFEDLNGGWYGRVGNFGVAIHPDDKVCTFETDVKSILTPSRSYVKYRCKVSLDSSEKCPDDDTDPNNGNGNIIANEGVNRPYSNQDFFITRKNQSCPSGLVTSWIEGTPMVGEKNFNRDTDDNLIDDTWEKNVVLSKVACDTDPTSTDPSITDGSCLHP